MSTNSKIAIEKETGEITAIYCHWDGYHSHNGAILKEAYSTKERVEELIALGSLSSLEKRTSPNEGESHSFSFPQNGVTVAYHRDRGEEFMQESFTSQEEFFKENPHYFVLYLFTREGKWTTLLGGEVCDLEKALKEISV